MTAARRAKAARKYEAKQVARIARWRRRRPGRITRLIEMLTLPIVWMFHNIIPHGAVEAALHGNLSLAKKWAHEHSALRALGAKSFAELAERDLWQSDRVARKVHRRAIYLAGGIGFASGMFGFLALPVGMAGAINVALRTIHRIGLCYGYPELDETERLFVYYTLSLAGSRKPDEKAVSLQALGDLQRIGATGKGSEPLDLGTTHPEIRHGAFRLAHHDFSKEITKQLVQVRLLTAIPVVGAGIGLIVDANYMRSVGWAARHVYQRRWLHDRGRWPEEGIVETASAA